MIIKSSIGSIFSNQLKLSPIAFTQNSNKMKNSTTNSPIQFLSNFVFIFILIIGFFACNRGLKHTPKNPKIPPRDQITMGNGESSFIVTDDFQQEGKTFTFKEVKIKGNGWLVMHPFKDGKPVPTVYVGNTYVKHGSNKNVKITVKDEPKSGENYILMLHWDVDQDKEFDFGDGINVLDAPVFEDTKMVAFTFTAKK